MNNKIGYELFINRIIEISKSTYKQPKSITIYSNIWKLALVGSMILLLLKIAFEITYTQFR